VKQKRPERQEAPSLPPEGDLKKILVVDDEPVIRDLCGKALKGFRVLEAGGAEEALKIFESGGIDIIITDVMMPKTNGIALLRKLKSIDPTLVVIIMTGFAEKQVILDALKEDADDFITKPLNLLQLRTTVEKVLQKKALKEQLSALKNLDRMKTNFLSLISHKFRTPITILSLFMENLASESRNANENVRQNLRMAQEEVAYLERLVADLLVFSRMMDDENVPKPEPCDLENIISKTVSRSKKMLRKPRITTTLEIDPLPPLLLDQEKIAFSIKQVVENALKFIDETGKIDVRVERGDDGVRIVVEDNGPGISPEELPKIFEKFYQVDPDQTGQVPGFGLGLYYAREFVQQHGGTIAIDSTPGKGTAVTIRLPLS
jgi:two-component system, sensor histidine kinase and response regulator